MCAHEAHVRIVWRTNDRFSAHVETRVDYDCTTSLRFERGDQVVILRVELSRDGLDTSRTIDVHIGRLRVKLSQAGRTAPQIISVRGFGYKIVSTNASPSALDTGVQYPIVEELLS